MKPKNEDYLGPFRPDPRMGELPCISTEEVVEALVALVYGDCTDCLSPDTRSRMGLFATMEAEIAAIKLLEKLGRVKDVREAGCGGIRADWVRSENSDAG